MAIAKELAGRLAREADRRLEARDKILAEIWAEHQSLCHSDGSECRDGCDATPLTGCPGNAAEEDLVASEIERGEAKAAVENRIRALLGGSRR